MSPVYMTPTRQQTALGEGLAVGMLAMGRTEILANILNIETAFTTAWRAWPKRVLFPSIRSSPDRNDISQVIIQSEHRRRTYAAWLHLGRTYRPYLTMQAFSVEESAESAASDHGVSLPRWAELAKAFSVNL